MMFKKKYIIEGLINKGFLVDKNIIVLQVNNVLKKIDSIKNETICSTRINNEYSIQRIERITDGYIGLSNGRVLFFNDKLEFFIEKKVRYSGYKLFQKKYLISIVDYDYSIFQGKYGIYELAIDKNKWETDYGGILSSIDGQNYFTLSLNKIDRRNFKDGKIMWTYSFDGDTKGKYPQLIGTTDNLIFLGIDSLDKLLAININDGSIKWELETIPKFEMLDSTKGKIHSLTGAYFCIDAESGKQIDSFQEDSYFDEIGIISQRGNYAIAGDHLITTDHAKGIIGAFNIVTHKFDWVHKEEGISFPGANPIKYCEPYLFVHDNMGTLHIFEKE